MNHKKRIVLPLLLLAMAALAISGWQFWAAAREQDDSDAQTQMKPETQAEALPLMDFAGLQAQNPEIIGWITIAELGVDYPVVQGTDNSYYLAHTAERKTNKLGALFLDFRAARDFTGFNSVVYGHYSKTGKMFGSLSRMKERAVFDRVTGGILFMPGKTCRLEIFAVVLTSSTSDFYRYIFPSPASRREHLDMIRGKAMHYRDIGVMDGDRLIALSTCSYEYEGARTLLISRIDDRKGG